MAVTWLVERPVFFVATLSGASLHDMADDSVAKRLTVWWIQRTRIHWQVDGTDGRTVRESGNWRMTKWR